MQFMVVAYDGNDEEAPARREAAKKEHVALGHAMIRSRNILFSTGILDDEGRTIGSMRVMQFEDRDQLDRWLADEPYVTQKVWQNIDVKRCRMGPAFEWITLDSVTEGRLTDAGTVDEETGTQPPAADG